MELDQGRTRDQGWWFGRLELVQHRASSATGFGF